MNKVVCPICQKTGQVKILTSRTKGQLQIGAWTCRHCHHAWRSEPWQRLGRIRHFERATYTNIEHVKRYDAMKMGLLQRALHWADEVTPKGPRLMLDFGCSCGTFMQMFREDSWNIMGIEISPTAQRVLDEQNLPWATCLEESGLARGSVDVVMMNDTIYYLPDPVGTLREIRSYMKPSGQIFLRQPTRGGLIHLLSIIDKKKALIDGLWLDHAHMFSRRSTTLLLEKSGFGSIQFIKERGFRRPLKGEVVHRLLRAMDCVTFGLYDLTLSWQVIAKVARGGKVD